MSIPDCYWFDPNVGCRNEEVFLLNEVNTNSFHDCIGFFNCSKYRTEDQVVPTDFQYKHDAVNHPNHYTQGGVECIDAIRAALGPDGFQASCAANVIKYVWRYRNKNGLEDLRKAQVYLGWLIESIEEEVNGER